MATPAATSENAAGDVAHGALGGSSDRTSGGGSAWMEQGVQCTGWVRACAGSHAPAGSSPSREHPAAEAGGEALACASLADGRVVVLQCHRVLVYESHLEAAGPLQGHVQGQPPRAAGWRLHAVLQGADDDRYAAVALPGRASPRGGLGGPILVAACGTVGGVAGASVFRLDALLGRQASLGTPQLPCRTSFATALPLTRTAAVQYRCPTGGSGVSCACMVQVAALRGNPVPAAAGLLLLLGTARGRVYVYRLSGDAAEGEADDGEMLPMPPPTVAASQGSGGGRCDGDSASPGAPAGRASRNVEPTQVVAAAGDEARLDATQPADSGNDHGDCGDHGDATSSGVDGGVLALVRVGGDLGLLVGGFRWGLALWQLGSRQLLSWFSAEPAPPMPIGLGGPATRDAATASAAVRDTAEAAATWLVAVPARTAAAEHLCSRGEEWQSRRSVIGEDVAVGSLLIAARLGFVMPASHACLRPPRAPAEPIAGPAAHAAPSPLAIRMRLSVAGCEPERAYFPPDTDGAAQLSSPHAIPTPPPPPPPLAAMAASAWMLAATDTAGMTYVWRLRDATCLARLGGCAPRRALCFASAAAGAGAGDAETALEIVSAGGDGTFHACSLCGDARGGGGGGSGGGARR